MLTVHEVDRLGWHLLEGLIMLTELFPARITGKVLEGIAAGEHAERSVVLDLALALAEDCCRDISCNTEIGLDEPRRSAVVQAGLLCRRAVEEAAYGELFDTPTSRHVSQRVLGPAEGELGCRCSKSSARMSELACTWLSPEPTDCPGDPARAAPARGEFTPGHSEDDDVPPAQMQELKNFIEARTQAYALWMHKSCARICPRG